MLVIQIDHIAPTVKSEGGGIGLGLASPFLAKLYVRNNWPDMTPKSVADGHRKWDHPKYKDYTPEEYDALWKRDTIDEFRKKAPALREAEKIKEAEDKIKEAEKKAEMAAKKAEAGEDDKDKKDE